METIAEKDISEKVMNGFRLAHKRLVEKAKHDDELIIADKEGKPVRVKARDL
ncbi:hypothetical protein [Spirosoma luteum]|uniref:hypothetical protein n=1 Tax=Spirosoma luteum TaxID=431553 RepID=UPI00039E3CD4|nr:hypothetical protein [Spirosoma luteum]